MPLIMLPEIEYPKQREQASCWVSAAHYILQYTPVAAGTLDELLVKWYLPIADSGHSAMARAGNPAKILKEYGYFVKSIPLDQFGAEALFDYVVQSITAGCPVICVLGITLQAAYFKHVTVIIGVNTDRKVFIYKDSAQEPGKAKHTVELSKGEYVYFSYEHTGPHFSIFSNAHVVGIGVLALDIDVQGILNEASALLGIVALPDAAVEHIKGYLGLA